MLAKPKELKLVFSIQLNPLRVKRFVLDNV
jgi:hypothetical protein